MQTAHVAQTLHDAFHNGGLYPESLNGALDLATAYQIQFELVGLHEAQGERRAGWKVGLTAKAMQEQQGVHEPCFGQLLESGRLASPAGVPFESLVSPGFENELCFRLGSDLDGGQVSYGHARAAIEAVAPAMEIIEKRCVIGLDFALSMAGNAQQRYFVTGDFVPLAPDHDLSAATVQIEVNGEIREDASGSAVLGDPVHSLVWLADVLGRYGRDLKAGDYIMSGSFTKQYDLAQGDHARAIFDPFGIAEFRCL